MFWQEETPVDQFQVPRDIIDLVFDIDCRELPVDHAHNLAVALTCVLPLIGEDPRIGIHSIHLAGSQNGWERPEHGIQNRLILSHRTKLILRIPKEYQAIIQENLFGTSIDIAGCSMRIGKAKSRPLSKHTTLFARHIAINDLEDEDVFLNWVAQELSILNISIRKALCGKTVALAISEGALLTRSLLLAELSLEESIKLQENGLGSHRILGCGIFLPHKGIGAVKKDGGDYAS